MSLPPSAIGIEQMPTKSKVNLFNLRSFDHLSKPHAQHLSNSLSPKVASLLRRRSTEDRPEIHSDRRSSALASFYSLSATTVSDSSPLSAQLLLCLSLSLTVCLIVCFSVCLLVAWYVCLFCFGKNRKATQ